MQGTITRQAAGLGLMMATSLVMAQQPGTAESPGAIQQQQQQEIDRRLRDERIQQRPVAPEISVPQGGPAAPASTAKTIRVEQILIDRSEILTQGQIDAIVKPLEGQTVSLADLQHAIDALNALYTAAGQATARAILPPQTVKDGQVRFRLVEAKVGDVRVNGAEAIDPAFITDRVALEADQLLSVPVLESALVRFNRLHSTQLRAGVVAGSKFGTTDVEITAVEPPRTKFSVFFDNAGRDTVGETRGGFNARFANLMGRSDTLQFLATRTEGSENYALSYSLPLDWHDLRLDLSASKGNISIVDGPFEPLDITGSSSDFTAGLTYPLIVTLEDMWSVYGRLSARESSSAFGGLEQEKLNLRVFTAGISGEHQSDDTAWYVDHSLASGITALGGDQGFLYYRGSATRFDRLSERFQLLLRGGLQLSDTRFLPASELFQIGGAYTVRGFSEGLLSGRNGYFVSAELRIGRTLEEYQAADPDGPTLHGIVFIDHGGALPYRPGNLKESTHDDYLTSVGVGVLFDFSERVTGRIVIGQPIRGNPAELHDKRPRAHVSLNIALN